MVIKNVQDAPVSLADVELLIAGGPTHAFSLSRGSTRQSAGLQGGTAGSAATGLREYLSALGAAADDHPPVVTFDTRVRHFPGSAARAAVRIARRGGFPVDLEPESFWVDDTEGPLEDGELDRARRWGRDLAGHVGPLG